ncbi:hypothetical protein GCM10010357_43820 [Streptomyces luteireticuli]|uniref:Uncharacterized protein n=1 Tax=Streptomyces luteireticuli TaxID=173858 RepID=A0ABP3IQY5_9ACTN
MPAAGTPRAGSWSGDEKGDAEAGGVHDQPGFLADSGAAGDQGRAGGGVAKAEDLLADRSGHGVQADLRELVPAGRRLLVERGAGDHQVQRPGELGEDGVDGGNVLVGPPAADQAHRRGIGGDQTRSIVALRQTPATALTARGHGHQLSGADDVKDFISRLFARTRALFGHRAAPEVAVTRPPAPPTPPAPPEAPAAPASRPARRHLRVGHCPWDRSASHDPASCLHLLDQVAARCRLRGAACARARGQCP